MLTDKIGGRIAPPRFLAFLLVALVAMPGASMLFGWHIGIMAGFDAATILFLAAVAPLIRYKPAQMRDAAKRNDANRALLLLITGVVMLAVLVAVAAELSQKGRPTGFTIGLVIGTLVLAWLFSNIVYALHYAHVFYSDEDADGGDDGGLAFPKTEEPDYWDFVYFAFCLGMTFQTSDVDVENGRMRRIVTAHCLAAFVFNLGVIAFTINVLGGG